MKPCFVLLLVQAVMVATAAAGLAVVPGREEMAQARRLVARLHREPGFSFTYGGRPSGELLAGWKKSARSRSLDRHRQGHTVTYTDPRTGLAVSLEAVEYRDFPAVEWLLNVKNGGTRDTPILERLLPLDLVVPAAPGGAVTLEHALGDSNSVESFAPREEALAPGAELVLAPNGGRSSDGHLPFFNLHHPGGGLVAAVGWSGQWEARFARTKEGVRLQAGMQLTHLRLHPGEAIRTPRVLLLGWQGDEPLRGTNLLRQLLLAHYLPRRQGELVLPPICASTSEVDPDGSYEGPHLRVMPILATRGIEVFWSDMDPQQWYPGGFPNGTGTWEPDLAKYPRGLAPIGEAAHAAGLGYLLWFEPERVHPGTAIDRLHPEWVLRPQGEWSQLFALHDPAARAWLTDYVDVQISAARLDWLRWDFNIEPLGFWRRADALDRQGMTEIRYLEGLYAMWDELAERHPGLVVDLCASGGRRIDLESLRRGLPLWHSDLQCSGPHPAADQLQNGGLSRWVPLHGCGNFGYEPSYLFRSAMTAGNILANNTADPGSEQAVKGTVAAYRRARPYLLGDLHPLLPHRADEDAWYGYQYHREELRGGMAILFRREQSPQARQVVRLQALRPGASYLLSLEGTAGERRITGAELARLEVEIPTAPGSAALYYRQAD